VQVQARGFGRLVILRRDGVIHKPGEDVADAALARLVTVHVGDDAAIDHAAHARHFLQAVAQHHVAGAGAHNHHHAARLHDARRRDRHVGVDIRHRHGDPRLQTHPARCLFGQVAGPIAQRGELGAHLLLDDVDQIWVQRRQIFLVGIFPVLVDSLVAGGAGVARFLAAQLPHHPVRRLEEAVGSVVDLRRLVENLQHLAEEPLRGNLPAVALQPAAAHLARRGVDLIGFRLGGVVLPQLDPGVRVIAQLRQPGQRRPVGFGGQDGARREVNPDADHVRRVDATLLERRRHGVLKRGDVVVRVLQRPFRRQRLVAARQPLVDHAVGVLVHRASQLGAVSDAHHNCAPRFCSKVNPYCVLVHDAPTLWKAK